MFFSRCARHLVRKNLYNIVKRNGNYQALTYRFHKVQRRLSFDEQGNPKPNVWNYYSKREIATLFIQPLVIILLYFFTLWQIFKYTCNIKDLKDFVKKIKWLKE